ncbi:GNAT family N-acetyltransferase [Scytonema hofmannii FACHB-248]|uniref:GNAT family N-acetyltransferase n=1 Tax=Scytonema hofmannii FACHB-248 TaxID=1842502 RepID=A0ABR8GXG1_9CYAN|nr:MULTISPECIES: GNAT family N-acetyltransferase [Nostocales]MBD2607857.1 GNAT family N-acetyltransferase [Scytonema hofmannii FACHB-248]
MTPQFEYSQNVNPEDVLRLGNILKQCFLELSENESYINRVGVENLRVIHQNKEIAGGLALISMSQWWGGVSVPMTGIAAVGIACEYRGTGAAIALMQHTIKELYTNGVPISILYPATQRLYRKAGYEQAGTTCVWEIPAESIQVREQLLPIKSVVPLNLEVFYDLYHKQATLNNGNLNRNQFMWEGVSKPLEKEPLYAYLIGEADQPQGYIIFSQNPDKDGAILRIHDWVVLTTAAAQTFWSFLANHRSQIDKIRWRSSPVDSLSLLLPEQTAKLKHISRWMLRVIDVVKALEKRGYPKKIQTELHLEVEDDLIAENNGKFILSIANGRGEVTKGGKGELQLDIKGLAPLYTGLFTPQQLQIAGKLQGTETSLDTATQIFAGSSPWMIDFF